MVDRKKICLNSFDSKSFIYPGCFTIHHYYSLIENFALHNVCNNYSNFDYENTSN